MNIQNAGRINPLYFFPLLIMIFTFTLLYSWIPPLKNYALMFVALAVGMLMCKQYFTKPMILAFVFYFVVIYFNKISGDYWISDTKTFLGELFKLLVTGMMGYAILISGDKRLIKVTIILFIVMLIVTVIGTSIVETIVPGSIRTLETMRHQGDESSIRIYYRFGMANYALPSGLVTIIPMLTLGVKMNKKNKKKRLFLLCGLIASLMLTYYSGSTTALILGVLGFIVSFFIKPGTGKQSLITLAFIGVMLTIVLSNDALMLSFLEKIDVWIGHEGYFHKKIIDFETLIIYGESSGDIDYRGNLYQTTWNAFLSDPLIGTNNQAGSHSLLLDHMGYLGLVGFIPFVVFVLSQIKLSSLLIPYETKMVYYISVFISIMMMLIKNMNAWECWLCLFTILPILAVYITTDIK